MAWMALAATQRTWIDATITEKEIAYGHINDAERESRQCGCPGQHAAVVGVA